MKLKQDNRNYLYYYIQAKAECKKEMRMSSRQRAKYWKEKPGFYLSKLRREMV
jgi:hypothetical protein